jgi:hypothetical protein
MCLMSVVGYVAYCESQRGITTNRCSSLTPTTVVNECSSTMFFGGQPSDEMKLTLASMLTEKEPELHQKSISRRNDTTSPYSLEVTL